MPDFSDDVTVGEINAGKLLVSTEEGNKLSDDVTTVDINGTTLSVSTEEVNQVHGIMKDYEESLPKSVKRLHEDEDTCLTTDFKRLQLDDYYGWNKRIYRLQKLDEDKEMEIRDLCQGLPRDKTVRVLCYGPVNSGKSSFIDSVMSTLTGKIFSKATGGYAEANTNGASNTEKFQKYQLKFKSESGNMQVPKIFFCDMPGIQDEGGVNFEQTKLIVQGHVPNELKHMGIEKKHERCVKDSETMVFIHSVCFLFDVSRLDNLSSAVKDTCKRFKRWIETRGIPYVVVLTKCDQICSAVKENALQIYENKVIRLNMVKLTNYFSFEESQIFPVCNYIHAEQTVSDIDALLLDALREILVNGYEYLVENIDDGNKVSDNNTEDKNENTTE